jgi:hypothetical protein
LPENLGCHSQELSKEAPFILKPKKECIIFLQRKQGSKAVNLRVRKRNRGGEKQHPPENKILAGYPTKQQKATDKQLQIS